MLLSPPGAQRAAGVAEGRQVGPVHIQRHLLLDPLWAHQHLRVLLQAGLRVASRGQKQVLALVMTAFEPSNAYFVSVC